MKSEQPARLLVAKLLVVMLSDILQDFLSPAVGAADIAAAQQQSPARYLSI
ncbi:MAG TPA: hypothetical protein PK687_05420 [Candidatus Avimonas sp.]|jgi:hypothetical protein|nr:hypothetical protein [Candidatus Avimonas sp.]